MKSKHIEVTCNKCGWVHMGVTRKYAEEQIRLFNEMYDEMPKDHQETYYNGKKASMLDWDRCFSCGTGATFRPFKSGDCPDGCTIQATVYEEQDEA